MNALRHDFDLAQSEPSTPVSDLDRMRKQWGAVQDAARTIAGLAQLAPPPTRAFDALGAALLTADAERIAACERALDDLTAVLHTGLTALLFAAENHCDTTVAALTLWRECGEAQTALFRLAGIAVPQEHASGS